MHKLFKFGVLVWVASTAAGAHATLVTNATGALTDSDPTQIGRITRNGIPSTWAVPKVFPGYNDNSNIYYYDEISIPFAANATQDVFYEIAYQNAVSGIGHLSAYLDDYLPTSLGTNYLGDTGFSSVAGTPRSFQVKVAAGHTLVLAFSTFGLTFGSYDYSVNAYSDANFSENFPVATVPEPATLALVGLALLGMQLSRRQRAT